MLKGRKKIDEKCEWKRTKKSKQKYYTTEMFANFIENEYKIVRNTKKTKPRLKNKEATKLRLQRRQYGINLVFPATRNLGFPATRNLGFPATIIFFSLPHH